MRDLISLLHSKRWQHLFATKMAWAGNPGAKCKIQKHHDVQDVNSNLLIPKSLKSVQAFLQNAITCPFWPFINIILKTSKLHAQILSSI